MKIGMLFSGYGSQYVGMAKELYDEVRVIQEYFEEASNCTNINFVKLCFASSDAEISNLSNANLSLFLTQVATAQAVKNLSINIDLIAGYGIGELSAICTAKGISFPDGLYLISKIDQFYTELISNLDAKILLIKNIDLKKLKSILQQLSEQNLVAYISAINSDHEFLVSGLSSSIELLSSLIKNNNGKSKILSLDYGLFSKLAESIIPSVIIYLEKVDFKDTLFPIVFTQDVKKINKAKNIKQHVINQAVSCIQWSKTVEQFADCDMIIITTPGKDLADDIKNLYPDKKVLYISGPQDLDILKSIILEN